MTAAAVAKPAAILDQPPAPPDPGKMLAVAVQKRTEAKTALERAKADFARAGKTIDDVRHALEHLGDVEQKIATYVASENLLLPRRLDHSGRSAGTTPAAR